MALASKNKGNKKSTEKEVPEKEVPEKEVPEKEVPEKEVPEKEVSEKEVSEKEVPEKEVPEKEVQGKAVTVKPKNSVAVAGKFNLALDDLADQLPPIEFGTLPMVKASQGTLMCEKVDLGKSIEFQVVSFNDKFAITPNENNADSSYCKFSYDGVTLCDGTGTTVADHIAYLKEEGYDKACAKRYVEVIGILEDAEEDHEEIGNMVTLNLSPMSVKQFDRYKLQTTVKLKQGKIKEDEISLLKVTAKKQSFGSNDFTIMTFSNL